MLSLLIYFLSLTDLDMVSIKVSQAETNMQIYGGTLMYIHFGGL